MAGVGLRRGLPVAGLLAAALLVLAVFLSDFYVREARTAASPEAALSAARKAEDLHPWALPPRYLQAAAFEDVGDVDAARAELEAALALEPSNFATIGLLGDLEQRAGNDELSLRYYRSAADLNPRDVGLEDLVGRIRREVDPSAEGDDGGQASLGDERPSGAEGARG